MSKSIVERMAEMLEQDAQDRCENVGGYPDDIGIVADHIVVASLDGDNEPALTVYKPEYVRDWYALARHYRQRHPHEDVGFWIWEQAVDSIW